MKDDIVLQTQFIGLRNLDQVGGHEDYKTLTCVIKGILLPENGCLYIIQLVTEVYVD